MIKRLLLAAAAASIVGGSVFYWHAHGSAKAQVMAAVRMSLIDPDSAQFGAVFVGANGKFGCGFVNAKNRMGGFSGRRAFIAGIDGSVELQPEITQDLLANQRAQADFLERGRILCAPMQMFPD